MRDRGKLVFSRFGALALLSTPLYPSSLAFITLVTASNTFFLFLFLFNWLATVYLFLLLPAWYTHTWRCTLACDCNTDGSVRPDCEQTTSKCVCKPGVHGFKCNHCPLGMRLSPKGCAHGKVGSDR